MDSLQAGCFYHIYNHANSNENLFTEQENYRYFLQQYKKYITPVADMYCYCLMPNHFHLLLQIKPELELLQNFPKFTTVEELIIANCISKQFSHLFSSYTQSINNRYERRGSLFVKNFKRKPVLQDEYFSTLVAYIHCNPVHHGFAEHPWQWTWSSYNAMFKQSFTFMRRTEIINWFGNIDRLKEYHSQYLLNKYSLNFDPER